MEDETLISKKTFIILFVILAVIAVAVTGFSKFKNSFNPSASPTPQSTELLFNDQQQTQQQRQNQSQVAGQQQTQQKQIKQYAKFPGVLPEVELTGKKAVIETNKGVIEFEIYPDSPKAASNFIILSKNNFYDGLTFHRVVPGFVIQGGDPIGTGAGGPGYQFEDEKVTRKYLKGTVAMANAGPNTNGSQFFIVLEDQPTLPPSYTIFGAVTEGMDVVDKIKVGDIMKTVRIEPI